MTCGNKIKNTCGKKVFAECVYYEGDKPEWSELDDCSVIEETTEEIYNKLTEILNLIDVSDFESDCEDLTILQSGGQVTLKTLLQTLLNVAEGIKCGEITIKEDVDISKWNLDLDCLSEPCDTPITKLSVLIQTMITKMCECCLSAGTGDTEIRFGTGVPSGSPSVDNPQRVYLRDNGELYVWFTTGTPAWLEIGLIDIVFNKGQFTTDADLADQGAYVRKVLPSPTAKAKTFEFTPEYVNGVLTLITPSLGFTNLASLNSGGGAFQGRWDGMVDFRGYLQAEGGYLSENDLPSPIYRLSALSSEVRPTSTVNRLIRIPGFMSINDIAASKTIYHVEYIIAAAGAPSIYSLGGLYVHIVDPQYDIDLAAISGGTDDVWNDVYFFLDPIKYFL